MATTLTEPTPAALPELLDAETLRRAIKAAKRRQALRRNAIAWVFMAPVTVFWVVFLLLPVGWVVRQSFQTGGVLGPPQWVGLDNWRTAFEDQAVRDSIGHTLKYTAIVVPASLVIGMLIALMLRELQRTGRVMRVLVYLPTLAPFVIVAILWTFLFNPDFGAFANIAKAVGTEPVNWLGDPGIALYSVAAVDTWRGLGFWAILLLAALIAVPHDLYSAAKLDRAGALRRFWHITLPSMRPTVVISVILATLFSMQVFDTPFVLTGGGPEGATETAVTYIYKSVYESGKPGMGAVVSILLLLIIVVLTLVFLLLARPRRSKG